MVTMIPLLALIAPAFAIDVDLHVSPPRGQDAWVTFHGVTPGTEQTANVPCARAPSCRLAVTITPEGEQWRIAVNVSEVRRGLFGEERLSLVGQPTFVAPAEQVAVFFMGGEEGVGGSNSVAFNEKGLHIQACVRATPAS